jgi:hypothetical protein
LEEGMRIATGSIEIVSYREDVATRSLCPLVASAHFQHNLVR